MKRLLLSLFVGLLLVAGVSFIKFNYVDRPAFKAGLQECSKDPLCDPSPYTEIGYPWAIGNYDDSSDAWQMLSWVSRPSEVYGQRPTRFWWGAAGDTLAFGALAYIVLWLAARRVKSQ